MPTSSAHSARLEAPSDDWWAYTRSRNLKKALEHAGVQVRVISRTVSDCVETAGRDEIHPAWLSPSALGIPLANLFSAIALYLDHFLTLSDDARRTRDDRDLITEIAGRRSEVNAATATHMAALMPDRWVLVGEIVSIADQLVADLTAASADLWPEA